MPIGERIGQAYVRVIMDGDNFDDEIEERLEGLDGKFRSAGDKNAQAYRKGYREQMELFEKDGEQYGEEFFDGIESFFKRQKGKYNAIQDQIRTGVFEDLFRNIEVSFDNQGDLGRAVGAQLRQNIEEGFERTGSGDFLDSFIATFPQQVATAKKQVVRELEALNKEVARLDAEDLKDRERWIKANAAFADEFRRQQEKRNADERKRQERFGDETLALIQEDHDREFDQHVAAAKREFDELIDDHDREFDQHIRHHRNLAELREQFQKEDLRDEKRHQRDVNKVLVDGVKDNLRELEAVLALDEQRIKSKERVVKAFEQEQRGIERATSAAARSRAEFDRLIRSTDGFREAVANGEDGRNAYVRQVNDLAVGLDRVGLFSERSRKDLAEFERTVRLSSTSTEKFRANVRRIERDLPSFGKGARNNFVNLFGIALRGSLLALPRLIASVHSAATTLFKGLSNGAQGIKDLGAELGGLIGSLGTTTVVGLGLVAAVSALAVVFAGPIASLVVGLTAALTALAATISFSLIGALVAVTALIAPLVAAIGVGVLAFKGMSDEMKKELKPAVEDLKDEFEDLGESAGDALGRHLPAALESLTSVVGKLEPLTTAIADSVGRVLKRMADGLDSSAFERFLGRLEDFLPGAIEALGESLSNLAEGLGGVFVAAIPQMERFLGFLETITQDFSDFANSREGRRSMRDFFKTAGDAAVTVMDTLGALKGLIGTLFDVGNETGVNILESFTENVETFTQFLKDNPDTLKDFFAGGEQVIKDVGDAFIAIGEALGTLDTEGSRDTLGTLLDFFDGVANFLDENEDFVEDLGEISAALVDFLGTVLPLLAAAPRGAGFVIWDALVAGWDAVTEAWDIFQVTLDSIKAFLSNPFGGEDGVSFSLPEIDFGQIVTAFTGLPGLVLSAIRDSIDLSEMFDVPSLAGIAAVFTGLPGAIVGLIAKQVDLFDAFEFPSLSTIAATFTGLPGAILAMIFQKVDLFDAFKFPDLGEIASRFAGLGPAILAAIGDIIPNISLPDLNPFGGGSGNPQRSGDLPRPSSSPEPAFTGQALGEPTLFKSPQKVEVEFDLKNSNLISGEVGKLSTDLDALDGKTAVPTVDVKDREALTKAQTFEQALRDIDGLISSTGLVVDSKGAKKKVDDFSRDVLSVAKLKPTATLQADDGPGNSTLNKLKNALKAYDNLSPEAQLKAKDESTAIVQRIQRLFSQYRNENPTTNINATSDVDGVVQAARSALDSIDGKTANTYIRTIRVGEGTGGGSGAQGGATQEFGAAGGLFTRATNITIGEDGPEALVPLNRALSRVDPAVRDLSAVLQGKVPVQDSGRTINQNITLTTPTTDPAAVAQELLNRVIASAAF